MASFCDGIVLGVLKEIRITPVSKYSVCETLADLRPKAVALWVIKLLEKIVTKHSMDHIERIESQLRQLHVILQ